MLKKIYNRLSLTAKFFREEVQVIRKDGGALLILFVALIAYPLVYSIAYQNEKVRDLKTVVVDQDRSNTSKKLSQFIDQTEEILVVAEVNTMDEARILFDEGKASGILFIPEGFESELQAGRQADVSVYADGSYFLLYRQMVSGSSKAIGTFAAGIEIKKMIAGGTPSGQAVKSRSLLNTDLHFLYNTNGGYGSYIMPGMVLIIIQQTLLIGIGMLGGTAREKGRYSFLIPTKLRKREVVPILLGKSLAYLLLYLLNCAVTLIWFYDWFDYPDRNSFLHLMMLLVPYLLAVIFMGITFSVLFRSRESSIMFMVFLSPIVMFLSGISWPVASIPPLLYKAAHVFPSTIIVPAYLRLRIMGTGLESVRYEYFLLLLQTAFYFVTAWLAIYFSAKHRAKKKRVNCNN